jgi:hypothetical protein
VTAYGPTTTAVIYSTIYGTVTETTTEATPVVPESAVSAVSTPCETDTSGPSPAPPALQPGYTVTETVTAAPVGQTPNPGEGEAPTTPCTSTITEVASSQAVGIPSAPATGQPAAAQPAPAQPAPSPYGGSNGQGSANVLTYTLPSGPSSPAFTGVITLSPNGPAAPNGAPPPATSPADTTPETPSAQQPDVLTITETAEATDTTPCESSTSVGPEQPEVITVTETQDAGPTSPSQTVPYESPTGSPLAPSPDTGYGQPPVPSASLPIGYGGEAGPATVTIVETSNAGPTSPPLPAPYGQPPVPSASLPTTGYGGEASPATVTIIETSNAGPTSPSLPTPYGSLSTLPSAPSAEGPSPSAYGAQSGPSVSTITDYSPTASIGQAQPPVVSPYGSDTEGQLTSTLHLTQTVTMEESATTLSWQVTPTGYNGQDTSEISPVYQPTPTSPYETYPGGSSPDCETSSALATSGSPVVVYTINPYGSPVPAATVTPGPSSPGIVFTSILSYGQSSSPTVPLGPALTQSPSETYIISGYGQPTVTGPALPIAYGSGPESESEVTILYTIPAENGNPGAILTITTDYPVPGPSGVGGGSGPLGGSDNLPTTTLCGSDQTSSAGAISLSGLPTISTAPGLISLSQGPGAGGSLTTPCLTSEGEGPSGILSIVGPQTGGSLSTSCTTTAEGAGTSSESWITLWPLPSTFSTSCTTTNLGGVNSWSSYVYPTGPVTTAAPFANTTNAIIPSTTIPITISIVGPSPAELSSPAELTTVANVTAAITARHAAPRPGKIRGMRY